MKTRAAGFTLIELILVIGCTAILGTIFLYGVGDHNSSSQRAPRINCTNNLKQNGLAFHLWASDYNGKFPMQISVTNGGTMELAATGPVFRHFLVMSNYFVTPRVLFCPAESGRARSTANTFARTGFAGDVPLTNDNQISYFVGIDTSTSSPSMFLCGDRNLALDGVPTTHGLQLFPTNRVATWTPQDLHKGQGNVGLADGSVQQLSSSRLRRLLCETDVATNRLAIP
jgi:prepilin-type processing-associated H-X9-DG protein